MNKDTDTDIDMVTDMTWSQSQLWSQTRTWDTDIFRFASLLSLRFLFVYLLRYAVSLPFGLVFTSSIKNECRTPGRIQTRVEIFRPPPRKRSHQRI